MIAESMTLLFFLGLLVICVQKFYTLMTPDIELEHKWIFIGAGLSVFFFGGMLAMAFNAIGNDSQTNIVGPSGTTVVTEQANFGAYESLLQLGQYLFLLNMAFSIMEFLRVGVNSKSRMYNSTSKSL